LMEGKYTIGIPVEDVNVRHGGLSDSSYDENDLRCYEGKKKENSYYCYRSWSYKSIFRISTKRI
jgi:hypothetical protein